jgi:tetratricopeptide (TPR) repeat protein
MSLNNLSVQLAQAGRWEEALSTGQDAVNIRRRLAEASPDAYLPDLAGALNNLGIHLAGMRRREEALKTSLEAVEIRRQLAMVSPGPFLSKLAESLFNLSARLAESGREAEIGQAWESAIAALPDESSRQALRVAQARYMLKLPKFG